MEKIVFEHKRGRCELRNLEQCIEEKGDIFMVAVVYILKGQGNQTSWVERIGHFKVFKEVTFTWVELEIGWDGFWEKLS